MRGFAVLDFETTGLHPGYHHRVVEVGVVVLDESGEFVSEYGTLINPERDLGAQDIHGVTAADASLAPRFPAVAGDLVELLRGRILVAHNAIFDLTFLTAELETCGYSVPRLWEATVCTMRLSDHYLDGYTRTLEGCCEAVGLPYGPGHHALADAQATARLLKAYLDAEPDAEWWTTASRAASDAVWPVIPPLATNVVGRGSASPGSIQFANLIQLLEKAVEPPYHAEYFALVDRVLADGKVTLTERRALQDFAAVRGLMPSDVMSLNRSYMMAVVRVCTADQILTVSEKARIIQFATLLGLPASDLVGLLAIAARDAYEVDGAVMLRPRDEVVLTGMSEAEKATLAEIARGLGLDVLPRVRRGCRLVVAQDAATQSGKARRAHELGVPVIDIESFRISVARLRGLALPLD